MEKLGTYLQQQREEQDITIDELVARTRIPIRYIEAIEKNQFDQLPNQVSAKGFLRSYAACVGVEYSVVAEAFTEYKGPNEPFERLEDKDEILSYLQVRRPIRVPFPRRIILSVVGVVRLSFGFGRLAFYKQKRGESLPSNTVTVVENTKK